MAEEPRPRTRRTTRDTRVDEEQQAQHDEQQLQAIRQTEQGLRQDEQGIRQDLGEATSAQQGRRISSGQQQQDLTDQITDSHTEQIIEGQRRQDLSDEIAQATNANIERLIEGVDLMAVQVTTLNERVYHKNYLDRLRNGLIVASIVTFIFVSSILGLTLYSIHEESKNAARREKAREEDTRQFRYQLADCEQPPGVVLFDGTINLGKCYTDTAVRTSEFVQGAIASITEEIKQLLIEQSAATAANTRLSREVRDTAAAQNRALRNLTTTTTTPPRPTPPPSTTVPPRPAPSSPTPTPAPAEEEPGLICHILRLLGQC